MSRREDASKLVGARPAAFDWSRALRVWTSVLALLTLAVGLVWLAANGLLGADTFRTILRTLNPPN